MQLIANVGNGYRFLSSSGSYPFSLGVIADPGYEIIRATFRTPIPFRAAFDRIASHLAALNRPKTAFCAAELRCARPYTAAEFQAPEGFNGHYVTLLSEWGLVRDDQAAPARTNVAPDAFPPTEQMVYAFSYSATSKNAPPSFVVSGATEGSTVAPNDTSAEGLRAKTVNVVQALDARLTGLGVRWDDATAISAYGVDDFWPSPRTELFRSRPGAARIGVHWYATRPPIA